MKSIVRRKKSNVKKRKKSNVKTTRKKSSIKRRNKYRTTRSRKNIRIRKKKYKGGNKDVCCICDKETYSVLTPISCDRRPIIGAKTHIICGDCWWPFAKETTDHACPGCKKEPLPKPTGKSSPPPLIDLT